jgi:DNA topoisomerase VI subunit B
MKRKNDREIVVQKSAAEFFSEHQQIAGFDNPGKSLFTTIREFVENSLDGNLTNCELYTYDKV